MLSALRLANFKAWKDTGSVRLAPITVFFGSNSAGKSSLLQFLLMLKQTAESPDRHRVLHPGDRNTPVELGTYRDLIFNHDVAQEIQFSLAWSSPEPLIIRDPLTQDRFAGSSVSFSASIKSDAKGAQQRVRQFEYSVLNNNAPTVYVKVEAHDEKNGFKYELTAVPYKLVRNQGRVWKLPGPIRYYGFPDEVGAYYQNAG